jgi:hypothetical protein
MIEEILISPFARDKWLAAAKAAAALMLKRYPDLDPDEIGDEQAALLPDGSAEIFVVVRDVKIALIVPPDQFSVQGGRASDV